MWTSIGHKNSNRSLDPTRVSIRLEIRTELEIVYADRRELYWLTSHLTNPKVFPGWFGDFHTRGRPLSRSEIIRRFINRVKRGYGGYWKDWKDGTTEVLDERGYQRDNSRLEDERMKKWIREHCNNKK
jgi:hypothetical protein